MGHEILDHFTCFRRIQYNIIIVHTHKQVLVQSSPSNIGRVDSLDFFWKVNLQWVVVLVVGGGIEVVDVVVVAVIVVVVVVFFVVVVVVVIVVIVVVVNFDWQNVLKFHVQNVLKFFRLCLFS